MNPPVTKVGYIVKRYPRFSETFIVNELLAHEAAGLQIEIFSLRPPEDTHFQDGIARVRAPVHYCTGENLKAIDFWEALEAAGDAVPEFWRALAVAKGEEARDISAAAEIARLVRQHGIQHLHGHFASS